MASSENRPGPLQYLSFQLNCSLCVVQSLNRVCKYTPLGVWALSFREGLSALLLQGCQGQFEPNG